MKSVSHDSTCYGKKNHTICTRTRQCCMVRKLQENI